MSFSIFLRCDGKLKNVMKKKNLKIDFRSTFFADIFTFWP